MTDSKTTNPTPPLDSVPCDDLLGLGWRWNEATKSLWMLFEVDGLAEDEHGNPCAAGVKVKIGPAKVRPDAAKCDAAVAEMARNGVPGCEGLKTMPITWAKYVEEGYDDE